MQPEILRVARKELNSFFASPVAYIFLGTFLLITLFAFFWADPFFARNIADARPLFEWMPLLLIFLVAALTMRMWSEERRAGTIEFLLTLPVSPLQLLLGKFLAGLALVALALLLTTPLTFTISLVGPLDWGPVWGGYLAALFLGAAYLSIGLYLSSRNENQIVSLISTVLVCGFFYLLGSELLTSFFGNRAGEFLKLLGSGSRFSSITRGIIDLRDLYYYLSLIGVFFSLTLFSLEKLRWAKGVAGNRHRLWGTLTLLLIGNLLIGNFWLHNIGRARLDLTEGKIYSLSDASRQYLNQLQEPLLIRGYFSAKTHPLLAPLVPRLRDLIKEYQLAGNGRVRSEFIDPQQNPDLEAEANQKYNISPVPFQVADRYQAALVNSYFHLLVQYGDQYEVLDFRDLIEIKQEREAGIDVELRNPEYELTRSIKKVMSEFQSGGDLFAVLPAPVTLTGYVSADTKLPSFLIDFKKLLTELAEELAQESSGKFTFELQEPEANGGSVARKIEAEYGFRPMQAGLFDPERFYFYLALADQEQTIMVALPDNFTKESLRENLEAGLKRFSSGYLKTVALAAPQQSGNPYLPPTKQFLALRQQLEANYNVRNLDLSQGNVPENVDILVVVNPNEIDEKGLFAIDQFLMKGGTVLVAASAFDVQFGRDSLTASAQQGPLFDWLEYQGLKLGDQLVLDSRNQPFPLPSTRNVGGFMIREMRLVPYPYFIDVRDEGLNQDIPVTAGLGRVMINWASPIELDETKTAELGHDWLLKSSPVSWTSDSTNLVPRVTQNGGAGFAPEGEQAEQLLAVALKGRFNSYFQGKDSPLLNGIESGENNEENVSTDVDQIAGVIDKSAESARLILFGSNDFISDQSLQLAANVSGQEDLGALQLVANTIDWSLEDAGLLSIRSRGHYSRPLIPLERQSQMIYEYLNYALVFAGLLVLFLLAKFRQRKAHRRYQLLLEGGA